MVPTASKRTSPGLSTAKSFPAWRSAQAVKVSVVVTVWFSSTSVPAQAPPSVSTMERMLPTGSVA